MQQIYAYDKELESRDICTTKVPPPQITLFFIICECNLIPDYVFKIKNRFLVEKAHKHKTKKTRPKQTQNNSLLFLTGTLHIL